MDQLPPNGNDPNNNNNNDRMAAKDQASENGGRNSDEIEMIGGSLGDTNFVMTMFLIGIASWMLREQCTC